MATIITEIYVSIDDLKYTKLDLFKDESISVKYSKKDIQDITKVFAPFSQNFTVPDSPKNLKALDFFGNTEIVKTIVDNKLFCKVYTDGNLNQKGILKIESTKKGSITVSFSTNFLSLKERIGEDLITNLSPTSNYVSWKADNVYDRLLGNALSPNGIKYYIPLWSNNRVWTYSENNSNIDNVHYKVGNNPSLGNVISIAELRPSIDVVSIINLIKSKYSLNIEIPLAEYPRLNALYAWCTNENFNAGNRRFVLKNQYANESTTASYITTANLTDSSIKLAKSNITLVVEYRLFLVNTCLGDNEDVATATIEIVKKSTNEVLITQDFEIHNDFNELALNIPLYLFESEEFEFYTNIKTSKPTFWRSSQSRVNYFTPFFSRESTYTNNLNNQETGCFFVDLIKSLPNMKVIDFLKSLFKTFNISIYDSSPNDENLLFLTPVDIETPNKSYTKNTEDYTAYASKSDVTKSVNSPYNYYNLKHKTSAYRSNIDFKNQFGIEYGQTYFPNVAPDKPNEFKIETEFSIIPPVFLQGSEIFTAYGFGKGAPKRNAVGSPRYDTVYNEMTLMYNLGTTGIPSLSCQDVNSSDVLTNSPLDYQVKSLPFDNDNNSLAFSVLKVNNIEYPKSLFLEFYSKFIQRLLNINALSQSYTINLPSSEIFLNDANPIRQKGFRLQNDIIIGETKFEILEANIDVTTGIVKATLLNY